MHDREKVLKGLECCRNLDPPNDWECPEECPYSIASNPCRCCKFTPLLDDAIALLEEQNRLIAEARNEGYNEAYRSYYVEVAEEDQDLRIILPYVDRGDEDDPEM